MEVHRLTLHGEVGTDTTPSPLQKVYDLVVAPTTAVDVWPGGNPPDHHSAYANCHAWWQGIDPVARGKEEETVLPQTPRTSQGAAAFLSSLLAVGKCAHHHLGITNKSEAHAKILSRCLDRGLFPPAAGALVRLWNDFEVTPIEKATVASSLWCLFRALVPPETENDRVFVHSAVVWAFLCAEAVDPVVSKNNCLSIELVELSCAKTNERTLDLVLCKLPVENNDLPSLATRSARVSRKWAVETSSPFVEDPLFLEVVKPIARLRSASATRTALPKSVAICRMLELAEKPTSPVCWEEIVRRAARISWLRTVPPLSLRVVSRFPCLTRNREGISAVCLGQPPKSAGTWDLFSPVVVPRPAKTESSGRPADNQPGPSSNEDKQKPPALVEGKPYIEVKTLLGQSFRLPFDPQTRVSVLRGWVWAELDVPRCKQRLLTSEGKTVDSNDATLGSYGIQPNSHLYLIPRMGQDAVAPQQRDSTKVYSHLESCDAQQVAKCLADLGISAEDEELLDERPAEELVVVCLDVSESMNKEAFAASANRRFQRLCDDGKPAERRSQPKSLTEIATLIFEHRLFPLWKTRLSDDLWLSNERLTVLFEEMAYAVRASKDGWGIYPASTWMRAVRTLCLEMDSTHRKHPLRPDQTTEENDDHLICSITQERLVDPVMASDGHTYERAAILKWFASKTNPNSPMTGLPLPNRDLVPNHMVRSLLQKVGSSDHRDNTSTGHLPVKIFNLDVLVVATANVPVRIRFPTAQEGGTFVRTPVHENATGAQLARSILQRSAWKASLWPSVSTDQSTSPTDWDRVKWFLVRDDNSSVDPDDRVDSGGGGELCLIVCGVWLADVNLPRIGTMRALAFKSDDSLALRTRLWLENGLWRPSETSLWSGLRESGDGVKRGSLLDEDDVVQTCASAGLTLNETSSVEYRRKFERDAKLERDGFSRLLLAKQMFAAFCDRTDSYRWPHRLGLVLFGAKVTPRCAITPALDSFAHALQGVAADGDTALYDAVDYAVDMLLKAKTTLKKEPHPDCALRIVVLTDGEDTCSTKSRDAIVAKLRQHNVVCDAICVGENANDKLLEMTYATCGLAFHPTSSEEAMRIGELETLLRVDERAPTAQPLHWQFCRKSWNQPTGPNRPRRKTDPRARAPSSKSLSESALARPANEGSRVARILSEFRNVQELAHPCYEVFVSDQALDYWKCVMTGPKRANQAEAVSPYEGACFELEIVFPSAYPDEAPCVRFVTPILHCNVNPYGRICHALLTRAYTRHVRLSQILDCVYGLILVPEVDDPIDGILAALYHSDRTAYESRVAESVRANCESLSKVVHRIRQGIVSSN